MKIQKLLITWGMIWLFVGLIHGFLMSPRIPALTDLERSAHSHLLCLAGVVISLGLMQPLITLTDKVRKICAWFTVIGSFLLPFGILLELVSAKMVFFPIFGSLLFIAGFLGFLVGALRHKF